ncbi:mitotic checkpoint serine/threonine-protein kinase BUB1 beta isoform X1 [Thunnus thynnus]|uniref:mitotic checkpoint serine/threonine-protein kinase BUB1 beta isoform X1 n=1 Tax=Thunnus thynnus TaxID=8237 RepID=UPI0035287EF0
MAEVGSCRQLANHSESLLSSQTHLSRGAGLQEEGGFPQQSAYCKDGLRRGGTEFSFEERRAERYNQQKQQQMDERLKQLQQVEQQLNQELEEKTRLLQLRRSQQVLHGGSAPQICDSGRPPSAASFQIFDESQSQPAAAAAALPSGNSNELLDDVFLRPDEKGLSVKIQYPHPGGVAPSEHSQQEVMQSDVYEAAEGHQKGATEDLQTQAEPRPLAVSQKPVLKTRKELSPIQETSVEASSLTSLGAMSAGNCSPLEEDQEDMDHAPSPGGGAVDPSDPDVRRRLLDLCDVTSSPDFHSEPRPLPTVEEHSCLQLGGDVFHIFSRILDGGSFSVYKGATKDDDVVIKVDSCSVLWDFHLFQRLKQNSSSAAASLPLISCFLFLDGCVTVYTSPPDHVFTELTECVPSEASVGYKAVGLLQLVSQLHSCRLLHAALQPHLLICCHRGLLSPDWVFPVDWSSSVDLDLQRITAVQQLPSAQTYISLGVLEPSAPPQLVDLVGVAETVHLLLTNSRMVPVKDDDGWTAEHFSGDQPCDMFSRMWRRFFRSLLNAGGRSSLSVLSELTELLSTLYH